MMPARMQCAICHSRVNTSYFLELHSTPSFFTLNLGSRMLGQSVQAQGNRMTKAPNQARLARELPSVDD